MKRGLWMLTVFGLVACSAAETQPADIFMVAMDVEDEGYDLVFEADLMAEGDVVAGADLFLAMDVAEEPGEVGEPDAGWEPGIPPIDQEQPSEFATATFSLG